MPEIRWFAQYVAISRGRTLPIQNRAGITAALGSVKGRWKSSNINVPFIAGEKTTPAAASAASQTQRPVHRLASRLTGGGAGLVLCAARLLDFEAMDKDAQQDVRGVLERLQESE